MGSLRKSQPLERCRYNVAHKYKSFNWIPRWSWVRTNLTLRIDARRISKFLNSQWWIWEKTLKSCQFCQISLSNMVHCFAVNSSSVMDCRPIENKYVEYVPMIGACSSNGTSPLLWYFSLYKRQLLELTLTGLS